MRSSSAADGLWDDFKSQFAAALFDAGPAGIDAVWRLSGERTRYYSLELMPKVAAGLELELRREFLTVDYAFLESGVPLVLVESENFAGTAHAEVEKLAVFGVPLRVLLTVSVWDDSCVPGQKGNRLALTRKWQEILGRHLTRWPNPGLFRIIVCEARLDRSFWVYAGRFTDSLAYEESVVLQMQLPEERP